ncbi:GNAT family N-acetyltransferase [Pseudoroseicyclus sp. CXY001]|uniref:GNAT family N-acetyltransferase n=1 Tax=Pseudoroseicyclus sp. CXY001 TaxID=3242492 RepID=UPI00358DB3D7
MEVRLRRMTLGDAEALHAAIGNAETYAPVHIPPPESVDVLRARIARQFSGPGDGAALWLNWCVLAEGAVTGFVQATVTGEEASLAYVLGHRHWGRGIGLAATRLAIAELVARYGVTRLIADTDEANLASQALLARLGFTFDRRDGRDLHYRRPA